MLGSTLCMRIYSSFSLTFTGSHLSLCPSPLPHSLLIQPSPAYPRKYAGPYSSACAAATRRCSHRHTGTIMTICSILGLFPRRTHCMRAGVCTEHNLKPTHAHQRGAQRHPCKVPEKCSVTIALHWQHLV